MINELPDSITLVEIEQRYPEAFHECARAFPALVSERYDQSLKVRDRALHHLGESRRVAAAVEILQNVSANQSERDVESGMSALGELLNQSHESLRDLYGLCTSEVNELIRIIRAQPGSLRRAVDGRGIWRKRACAGKAGISFLR